MSHDLIALHVYFSKWQKVISAKLNSCLLHC